MLYTYTCYTRDDVGTPVRKDITTRFEEIKEADVVAPNYVDIYNNQKMQHVRLLSNLDDFENWQITLERVATWKPEKPSQDLPDANLKTRVAINKPTLSAIPPVAIYALGAAMQDGVNKYEKYNWRDAGATSSIFFDAMCRHLFAWYAGEDHATDSKIHHLGHLMAGCAIIMDAELHGKLNDDRKASDIEEPIKAFMEYIKGK
jgi:hypothetical protein